MNIEERNAKLSLFFQDGLYILAKKGKDYNPTDMAFDDLRHAAKTLGIKLSGVLWVYMQKHINAVESYIKNGSMASEPIRGRLMDLANYCGMMAVLIEEEKHGDIH